MGMNLRLRHTLAWWLLAVMLLGALAPTVSRARAAAHGTAGVTWMEVCTSQGTTQVAVQDDSRSAPDTVVVDHCLLCVLGMDRLAPPPHPFVWQGLPQGPPQHPLSALSFILTDRPWSVQSRAPPAFL